MQQYLDSSIQFYTGQFAHQQASIPDDLKWLSAAQMKAMSVFQSMGFPTRKTEDWKYTKLNEFLSHEFSQRQETISDNIVNPTQLVPYIVETDCYRVVLVNGQYMPALSNCHEIAEDIDICPLDVALKEHPAILKPKLEATFTQVDNAFAALNLAMLRDGLFIYLKQDTQLTKPIQIIHIGCRIDNSAANHIHHFIIAEQNTQAQIIESYISVDDSCYFTNTVTDIHAASNAFIEHVKYQQESKEAFHVGIVNAYQAAHSTVNTYSLSFGGKLVRSDATMRLGGDGAMCRLEGLFMVNETQYCDHHVLIHHTHPNGDSNQNYRGILADKATGVFNGKIYVHPEAQKTNAHQQNKNILLSAGAQMNTKPDLEIYADDVKCSHGATVGQLDQKQLFYLQSRGLPYPEAEHLLTYAFASSLINRLPSASHCQYANEQLIAKLPQGDALRGYLS